ncbi:MAG: sensor histidine kinase [Nannocystaceae bacterium]|nr:sensor histidine kinase [Nannocystaceae bacterium]
MPRTRLLPHDPDLGWAPWVWLGYVAFPFFGPVFTDEDWTAYALTTAAVIVFLPLYVASYWVHGARRVAVGFAMAGLGAAIAPVNVCAGSFFGFGAYAAGSASERTSRGVLATLAMTVAAIATSVWLQPTIYFWGPAVFTTLMVGMLGVQQVVRQRQLTHLRLAREEVDALARIAERERIGRDLHDLLGHSLSVIALKAELAERLLEGDRARVRDELVDVQTVARHCLAEVRTAVRGYRVGSGAGLRQELDNAGRALAAAGVELHCDGGPELVAHRLDAAREGALALALREAVTNIVRHASARRCEVEFFDDGAEIGVTIVDDGRGAEGRVGAGLSGMRERVTTLGGRLELAAEAGTRIRLTFPRPQASEVTP